MSNVRPSLDSPGLRRLGYAAWLLPPLILGAGALMLMATGRMLDPIVAVWLMLAIATTYFGHLCLTRFDVKAPAAGATLLGVAGIAVAVHESCGAPAALTTALALMAWVTRWHCTAAATAELLERPAAAIHLAGAARDLGVLGAVAGAGSMYLSLFAREVYMPMMAGGALAVLLGLALVVPAWRLSRRARRRALDLLQPPSTGQ